MIKCIFSLCAEGITIDQMTNLVSVYNIMEEITSKGYPSATPYLAMYHVLTKDKDDPREIDCKVRITNNTEVVFESPTRVNFLDQQRARIIGKVGGLIIPNPGSLFVELLYGEDVLDKQEIPLKSVGAGVLIQPEVVRKKKNKGL